MKIPLLWLKDYLDLDKSPREIADSFTKIGLMLDKPVGEDKVLDLEQRLNRSDLLSIVGCARDLSVFENVKLKEPKVKLHKALAPTKESRVEIKVDTPAVNRFNTRVFRGIAVKKSPTWLKERLELYGIGSVNNIVDITNFVMVELGQPMHAQDLDKLPAPEISIRPAKKGEKITTLLGTEITLDEKAFVLTSAGKPMVIGGIVGGADSGVTNKTVNIVLDAGNYDPRVVRTASRHLKIMNETVSRYDKPLNPRLTEVALERATDLILELAGGAYYQNEDYYPHAVKPQALTLSYARLQLISGLEIPAKKVKSTLQALGYQITDETEDKLTVEVPYYRTDVEVEDDLISDILRMYDYNRIPSSPLVTAIPSDITPELYKFEEKLRDYLIALGAHEHITTQLVTGDDNKERVTLENALSEEQNALRLSALETLPTVLTTYHKHQIDNPLLFEIGKSFRKTNYEEIRELAVIDPTNIRQTLATLLQALGITNYLIKNDKGEIKVLIGKSVAGLLNPDSFVLYTPVLLEHATTYPPIVSDYSHQSSLDLSLSLPANLIFDSVVTTCRQISPSLHSLEVVEEYGEWKLVRLTWNKTIQDLNKLRQSLVKALKEQGIVTRSG